MNEHSLSRRADLPMCKPFQEVGAREFELPLTLSHLSTTTPGAEEVRFELTRHCCLLVFKTSALSHSATLPESSPRYALEDRRGL